MPLHLYRLGNGGVIVNIDCGISLGEAMIADLDFADAVVIYVETLEVCVYSMDTLSTESKTLGLMQWSHGSNDIGSGRQFFPEINRPLGFASSVINSLN